MPPPFARLALLAAAASVHLGCTDSVKVSEEKAAAHAATLGTQIDTDVAEIRRGLPAGGKKLDGVLFVNGSKDVSTAQARSAIRRTREMVPDLQLAKSTFFAVADPNGLVYANDQETDAMAGKNLVTAFPALAPAGKGAYAETIGKMDEARGVNKGDDIEWVAAAPVLNVEGKVDGIYVTGWSFRRFAFHLEEQLKSNLRQEGQKVGPAYKMPLVYAFVVLDNKAYGTPVAPEVNQKAVEGLSVNSKLTDETTVWHGRVDITDRTYGVAARRAKALCDTCAVVVLRSEV